MEKKEKKKGALDAQLGQCKEAEWNRGDCVTCNLLPECHSFNLGLALALKRSQ